MNTLYVLTGGALQIKHKGGVIEVRAAISRHHAAQRGRKKFNTARRGNDGAEYIVACLLRAFAADTVHRDESS